MAQASTSPGQDAARPDQTNGAASDGAAAAPTPKPKSTKTPSKNDKRKRGAESGNDSDSLPARKSTSSKRKAGDTVNGSRSRSPSVHEESHNRTDQQLSRAIEDYKAQAERDRAEQTKVSKAIAKRPSEVRRKSAAKEADSGTGATIDLAALGLPSAVVAMLNGPQTTFPLQQPAQPPAPAPEASTSTPAATAAPSKATAKSARSAKKPVPAKPSRKASSSKQSKGPVEQPPAEGPEGGGQQQQQRQQGNDDETDQLDPSQYNPPPPQEVKSAKPPRIVHALPSKPSKPQLMQTRATDAPSQSPAQLPAKPSTADSSKVGHGPEKLAKKKQKTDKPKRKPKRKASEAVSAAEADPQPPAAPEEPRVMVPDSSQQPSPLQRAQKSLQQQQPSLPPQSASKSGRLPRRSVVPDSEEDSAAGDVATSTTAKASLAPAEPVLPSVQKEPASAQAKQTNTTIKHARPARPGSSQLPSRSTDSSQKEVPEKKTKSKRKRDANDDVVDASASAPIKKRRKEPAQKAPTPSPPPPDDSQVDELQSTQTPRASSPARPSSATAHVQIQPQMATSAVQTQPQPTASTSSVPVQTAQKLTTSTASQTPTEPPPQKPATRSSAMQTLPTVPQSAPLQVYQAVPSFARPSQLPSASDLAVRLQSEDGADAWAKMMEYEREMNRLCKAWTEQRARLFGTGPSQSTASPLEPLSAAVLPQSAASDLGARPSLAPAPTFPELPAPALASAPAAPQSPRPAPVGTTGPDAGVPDVAGAPARLAPKHAAASSSSSSEDDSSSDSDSDAGVRRKKGDLTTGLRPSLSQQRPPPPRKSVSSASQSTPRLKPQSRPQSSQQKPSQPASQGTSNAPPPRLSLGNLRVNFSSDEDEEEEDESDTSDEEARAQDRTLTTIDSPEPERSPPRPRRSTQQKARSPSSEWPDSPPSTGAASPHGKQAPQLPSLYSAEDANKSPNTSAAVTADQIKGNSVRDDNIDDAEIPVPSTRSESPGTASDMPNAGAHSSLQAAADEGADKTAGTSLPEPSHSQASSKRRGSEARGQTPSGLLHSDAEAQIPPTSRAAPPSAQPTEAAPDTSPRFSDASLPVSTVVANDVDEKALAAASAVDVPLTQASQAHSSQNQDSPSKATSMPILPDSERHGSRSPSRTVENSEPDQVDGLQHQTNGAEHDTSGSSDSSMGIHEQLVRSPTKIQQPGSDDAKHQVNGFVSSPKSAQPTGSQKSPPKRQEPPLFKPTQASSKSGSGSGSDDDDDDNHGSSSSSEDEQHASREGLPSSVPSKPQFPASASRTSQAGLTQSPLPPRPSLRSNKSSTNTHSLSDMLTMRRNSNIGARRMSMSSDAPSAPTLPPISASQPATRSALSRHVESAASGSDDSDDESTSSGATSDGDGKRRPPPTAPTRNARAGAGARLQTQSQPTRTTRASTAAAASKRMAPPPRAGRGRRQSHI